LGRKPVAPHVCTFAGHSLSILELIFNLAAKLHCCPEPPPPNVAWWGPKSKSTREGGGVAIELDAAAAGAERSVLVTLGRYSEPARQAAIATTPTVDLIVGQKLCELVREKEIGIRIVPQVQETWFDRFDA
jgi:Restriction endonuclease